MRERDESVLPCVFIPPPAFYVFIEGRSEKDSDGDDIGDSIVATTTTTTTKELVLEEERLRSESSSFFVEERSDDDFGEDDVFACI